MAENTQDLSFDEFMAELENGAQAPKRTRRSRHHPDIPPLDMEPEPARTPKPARVSKREQRLQEVYYALGSLVMPFDQYDGALIVAGAPDRAREVAKLAKEYPAFGDWIDKALAGSPWVPFILGHGTLAFLIAAHHGLIPHDMLARMPFARTPETAA